MNRYRVCDLHCDLLSYLAIDERRDPCHLEVPCGGKYLQEGEVGLQTCAIFSETKKGSSDIGFKQLEAFTKLKSPFIVDKSSSSQEGVEVMLSIENASCFAEEDEEIEKVFLRLTKWRQTTPILYISLTWNTENRFGGGNVTNVGLKKDGEALLDFLSGKGIAIDFSHTSDKLAYDILNYIDKKGLKLKVLASHSNFRAIFDHARNLPDDIAQEIIRRKGVIGLNLFRHFVGEPFQERLVKMCDHALVLGGEDHLCFGGDFFYAEDFNTSLKYAKPFFAPGFDTSACYPKILSLFQNHFSSAIVEKIAYKNFYAFNR